MTKQRESEAFVDIGGYVYHNEGNAKVKMHIGEVNKPLKPDDATKTQRLKKIRVYMGVEEDKSVQGNQVYEKDINMWQEQDGTDGKPRSTAYENDVTPDSEESQNNNSAPSGLQVLKNFVDKIKDEQLAMWIVIIGIGLLAIYALVR